jgi:hypothetical protein
MGDINLMLSSIAGPVGEVIVQRTSLGRQVKEDIEKATDGNFKALGTRIIFEQGDELRNEQQLLDVVSDAATEAAVLLIRGGPYDATYTVNVSYNGPRNVTILGGFARLTSGDFPIEWDSSDSKKCSFTVHTISSADGGDLEETYEVEFLGDGPENGLKGKFQQTHEFLGDGPEISIRGSVAKE